MRKATKRVLFVALGAVVAGAGIFAWGVFNAFRTFGVEDQIHGTFFPVSIAIGRFAESNGTPPKALDQLVPSFLPAIPTSPLVHRLEYTVVDGTNWIMNAYSTVLKPGRVYSWRSDWRFTDQEKANLLKEFHNVAVFRE